MQFRALSIISTVQPLKSLSMIELGATAPLSSAIYHRHIIVTPMSSAVQCASVHCHRIIHLSLYPLTQYVSLARGCYRRHQRKISSLAWSWMSLPMSVTSLLSRFSVSFRLCLPLSHVVRPVSAVEASVWQAPRSCGVNSVLAWRDSSR